MILHSIMSNTSRYPFDYPSSKLFPTFKILITLPEVEILSTRESGSVMEVVTSNTKIFHSPPRFNRLSQIIPEKQLALNP